MWSYKHAGFVVHQLPALADNYIYLIDAPQYGILACIDPPAAPPVIATCKKLKRKLTHILNTHHHWDHTDGNSSLKEHFSCTVIGPADEPIPGRDVKAEEGAVLPLGGLQTKVLAVPGHTLGHVAFVIGDALFCGDTLFACGCGRLFEGTPAQMWASLNKLMALPDATRFYCAHEYTLKNLDFALHVDPENKALKARNARCTALRRRGAPTVPATLAEERATNPFLRPLNAAWRRAYAMRHDIADDPACVFAHLRAIRDRW